MTKINEAELEKLTRLARIACSAEEREALLAKLSLMLSYIDQLKELDTDKTAPCSHILPTVHNVFREDTIEEPMSRDLFLKNAPSHVEGMVRVPTIIQKDEP